MYNCLSKSINVFYANLGLTVLKLETGISVLNSGTGMKKYTIMPVCTETRNTVIPENKKILKLYSEGVNNF